MTFAQQRNERIFVVKRRMTVLCGILDQTLRDAKLAFCTAVTHSTGTVYLNAEGNLLVQYQPAGKVRDGNSCIGNVENETQ